MFQQTPRTGLYTKPQTPDLVGPTTYILCDKRPLGKNFISIRYFRLIFVIHFFVIENRVPFLSTDIRNPSFIQKLNCEVFYTLPDETIKVNPLHFIEITECVLSFFRADRHQDSLLRDHLLRSVRLQVQVNVN